MPSNPLTLGRRIAVASIVANILLASGNIAIGWLAGSTSAVAAGVEFGADAVAAGLVYAGFIIAGRPADLDHPYGHGRAETIVGLVLGMLLVVTGIGISSQSLHNYRLQHPPPAVLAVWPLVLSILIKSLLMGTKFRYGRKIRSAALVADGWNDSVDILSAGAALVALGLTLYDPARFLPADHFGGFAVGLVVAATGLGVARNASLGLMDTMAPADMIKAIRVSAHQVEGVKGIEKCWARKTGLRYHVDLHLEVDRQLSVAAGHSIAQRVRQQIRRELPEVADVLVHVEPVLGHDGDGPSC